MSTLSGTHRPFPGRAAFLCLLALALGFLAGCARRAEPEPLRVGHVASSEGPGGRAAGHARQAILLAAEEADRAGPRPITVYHPQRGGGAAELEPQAVRLVTVNRVTALLAGEEAALAEGLEAVAQNYAVPLLTPADLPRRAPPSYVFCTGLTPGRRGRLLARFAAHEFLPLPFLVLVAADAASGELADAFMQELAKAGGTMVGGKRTYTGTAELASLVRQAARVEAVLLAGPAADVAGLDRLALGKKAPVVWGGPEAGRATLEEARPAQMVYLATVCPVEASPHAREFAQHYRERFGEAPGVAAIIAYDDARLVFEAARRAKSPDGPGLREALEGLKGFEGLTGAMTFGEDHVARRPAFIVRLRAGRAEPVPFEAKAEGGSLVGQGAAR